MSKETLNPLLAAQAKVKEACDALGTDPAVYELLKEPQRIIEITIPVKMDDGSIKTFKGYRSAHNDAVGPFKGGIRFHQNVNADEVKALSIWMSIKCQVTGIPYGGGKGGITVDPSELSQRELEQLSRGWVRGMYKYLGEKVDVPAPDVNTNGQIMAWMQDEYNKLTGEQTIGVFTGKPLTYGGSQGRNEATGFGVAVTMREACKAMGTDLSKETVAVQGFGNVGKYTVKNIMKLGGKVVAVAEFDKAVGAYAMYKPEGFTFAELEDAKTKDGNLFHVPGAKQITMDEFWALDVPQKLKSSRRWNSRGDLMLKTLKNAFKIKDVRRRLFYVLLMLVVVRIGSQLPIPGVDSNYFKNWFASQSSDAFNFFDAFTGGSFTEMSIFALSITPYIYFIHYHPAFNHCV